MRLDSPSFVPVMISPPCHVWNKSIVRELGFESEMATLESGKNPIEVLKKAEKLFMKSKFKVSGHIADLMWNISTPPVNSKDIRNYLIRNIKLAAELPRGAEAWFSHPVTEPYHIFDSMELLRQRKTFFSGGLLMYVSSLMVSNENEFVATIPDVSKNEKIISEVSGFIVNSSVANKDEAWDFIRFIISEESQSMMTAETQCLAMLKKANMVLPFSKHTDEQSLKSFIASLASGDESCFKFGLILAEMRKNFFSGLIRKTVSVDEAIEKTMMKIQGDF
jgi:hypothetical protein